MRAMRILAALAAAAVVQGSPGRPVGAHDFFVPHQLPNGLANSLTRLLQNAAAVSREPAVTLFTKVGQGVTLQLPSNCTRVVWRALHGGFESTAASGTPAEITSGVPFPSSELCTLRFQPDAAFFGQQWVWFATAPSGAIAVERGGPRRETLHAALIVVQPGEPAAIAVDDGVEDAWSSPVVEVEAGDWALLPVLNNDEAPGMPPAEVSHACLRPGVPAVLDHPSTSTGNSQWLHVVVIEDTGVTDVSVSLVLDAQAHGEHGVAEAAAVVTAPCLFDGQYGARFSRTLVPRCVALLALPSPATGALLPATAYQVNVTVARRSMVVPAGLPPQALSAGGLRPPSVTHVMHHVPLRSTLFVRHADQSAFVHDARNAPADGTTSPFTSPFAALPTAAGGAQAGAKVGMHVLFANATVPECTVLRVGVITRQPMHGRVLPVAGPMARARTEAAAAPDALPAALTCSDSPSPAAPAAVSGDAAASRAGGAGVVPVRDPGAAPPRKLPCFAAGGPMYEEDRAYIYVDHFTGQVVFPPFIPDVGSTPVDNSRTATSGSISSPPACAADASITMKNVLRSCGGEWVSETHTPTQAYALPHEHVFRPTAVLYYAPLDYEGTDTFTYEVDGAGGALPTTPSDGSLQALPPKTHSERRRRARITVRVKRSGVAVCRPPPLPPVALHRRLQRTGIGGKVRLLAANITTVASVDAHGEAAHDDGSAELEAFLRRHNAACDELQAALVGAAGPSRSERDAALQAQLVDLPGLTLRSPLARDGSAILGVSHPLPLVWPAAFDGSDAALAAYDEVLFASAARVADGAGRPPA